MGDCTKTSWDEICVYLHGSKSAVKRYCDGLNDPEIFHYTLFGRPRLYVVPYEKKHGSPVRLSAQKNTKDENKSKQARKAT